MFSVFGPTIVVISRICKAKHLPAVENNRANNGHINNVPPIIEPYTNYRYGTLQILSSPSQIIEVKVPYKPSDNGLGINIAEKNVSKVYTAPEGHTFKFNEPENAYGLRIMLNTVQEMKELLNGPSVTCIGERSPFNSVMNKEGERLIEEGEYKEKKIHNRQLNLMWGIQKGFITPDGYNLMLHQVTREYALFRIGVNPYKGDELHHAIQAVKKVFVDTTKDNKSSTGGFWTLPIIYMMNDYIVRYLNIPTVQVHPTGCLYRQRVKPKRRACLCTIWIDIEGKRTPISVESRNGAVAALLQFINNGIAKDEQHQVPDDLGTTVATMIRGNRKRRHSLNEL